jgi:hypothetical protein
MTRGEEFGCRWEGDPMNNQAFAFAFVTLLGLPLVACANTSVGLEDAEVLALVEVGGVLLPADIDEGAGTSRVFVADTIWLLPDDTWQRHQVEIRIEADGNRFDVGFTSDGFVTLEGEVRVLDFECNDLAARTSRRMSSCVPPDRLVRTDLGWEIDRDRFPGSLVLSYVALPRN